MRLLALVALLLLGTAWAALPDHAQIVRERQDKLAKVGPTSEFLLKSGESRLVRLVVPSGLHGALVTCDEHCYDLSLKAFRQDGALIAEDAQELDIAEVEFLLRRPERVFALVSMNDCNAPEGCKVSMGLLSYS